MKKQFALVLALGVLLGACGQPGSRVGSSDALHLISAASAKTNEASTARISVDMNMEFNGQAVDAHADGAMEIAKKLAHMTMTMSGAGLPEGFDMEMVMDGFKMYYKMPPELGGSTSSGKPWIFIDMQAFGESQGMDYNAMSQAGGSNPLQLLEYLNGVAGEVKTVGDEEVRGVITTHYSAAIDFDKMAENAPARYREAIKASVDVMKQQLGDATAPIEVWVGEDGYVHRFSMSFDASDSPSGSFKMTMTMEMFDFGAPVDIQIPPASQVTDRSGLMGTSASPSP
ncbi:MAG: hypothetical protein QOG04_793 [Actinomycetota bacterium]|nr:hypothetical protein [Actinomycetota bacterium]